jgi:hypothetical protein
MEIVNSQYPRWVYSDSHPSGLLLRTEAEFDALKGVWYSHPNLLPEFMVKIDQRDEAKAEAPQDVAQIVSPADDAEAEKLIQQAETVESAPAPVLPFKPTRRGKINP